MAPTQKMIDEAATILKAELESPEMAAAVHGIEKFDDFPEAFDYCRDTNAPVIVMVAGDKWKLYPSGHAKKL